MPDVPPKFKAWAALTQEDGKKLHVQPYEYEPKKWTEHDVDIKIEQSSICGSCLHTITSGWGEAKYPCVVGHEIVGRVVRAGKQSGHEVGEMVGVGAQGGVTCGPEPTCDNCKAGHDQFCEKGMVGTYQGVWPEDNGEGRFQQGGYGEYHRTRGHFAIKLDPSLKPEHAAPMMCGGVTLWTPLKRFGAGPGKKVAILGIGGLGHFGLLFSIALGAETYAISHSASKKQDCVEKMGLKPDNFIVAEDIEATSKKYASFFDLIIVTANHGDPPVAAYLAMVRAMGKVCFVALAETPFPRFSAGALIGRGVELAGSKIGSPAEIKEMLDFVVKHNIHPIIEQRPMRDVEQALKDMQAGKARYRIVLDASDSGLQ